MDQTRNEKSTSEGEEVSMEKFIAEATTQVEQLKNALVERAATIEELHVATLAQEQAFQEELAALKQEIEALKKSLEEAKQAENEAVAELSKIREEALLRERISTLGQNGLLRSDEEARTKQAEKIKAMSNEDFSSYVEDLLDARTQALKSVSTTESTENLESSEKNEVQVVDSEDSASGDETLDKVLSSLAKPAENAEAEKKEEALSKESASTQPKVNVKRLSEGFGKMMSLNLKQDSEKKEGWL